MMEYLPLDRIYDSRWENSRLRRKLSQKPSQHMWSTLEKDLDTIRAMESEFEDKGLAKYRATLELSEAHYSYEPVPEAERKEILRRQAEEEQERERHEEGEARRAAEEEQRKAALVHEEPVVPEVCAGCCSGGRKSCAVCNGTSGEPCGMKWLLIRSRSRTA
ncbi:MAG: hypothetical protein ACLR78_04975 [Roseburia sp.]